MKYASWLESWNNSRAPRDTCFLKGCPASQRIDLEAEERNVQYEPAVPTSDVYIARWNAECTIQRSSAKFLVFFFCATQRNIHYLKWCIRQSENEIESLAVRNNWIGKEYDSSRAKSGIVRYNPAVPLMNKWIPPVVLGTARCVSSATIKQGIINSP